MTLRDYQTNTIDRVRTAVKQNSRSICVVMPTGAGKTRTFAEVARRMAANGRPSLWLAHRAELVDQAYEALRSAGVIVGCISASAMSPPNPFAPVQVATVQTLLARRMRPPAELIVADEAHHYVADEFSSVLQDYPKDTIVIGPTATPERSDGRGLGAMFTRIIVGVRVRELVDQGFLVPSSIIAPRQRLKQGQIAQRPVDAYLEHASGRPTIVFSPSVAQANIHADEFNAKGIVARVITGDMPWAERTLYLEAFRSGQVQVLVNVYVLTEGFDVPATSCVILARGCGTSGTYIQMVGRALRPAPGKKDAVILDLHGVSHMHGHPEDDRKYQLDGRGILRGDDINVAQSYCRVCGAPIEPGTPCDECGTAPKAIAYSVTGEKLVPYARKRAEGADDRAKTLAKWLGIAKSKGYKTGWAYWKYSAVYGCRPEYEVQRLASKLIAGVA